MHGERVDSVKILNMLFSVSAMRRYSRQSETLWCDAVYYC